MSQSQLTASYFNEIYGRIPEKFNPDSLNEAVCKGDERMESQQLYNWIYGRNQRVVVENIPVELLPKDGDYRVCFEFFRKIGTVRYIEFDNNYNENTQEIEYIAFIHFKEFYESDFPENIANAFPEAFESHWEKVNNRGFYKLKFYIDTNRYDEDTEYDSEEDSESYSEEDSEYDSYASESEYQDTEDDETTDDETTDDETTDDETTDDETEDTEDESEDDETEDTEDETEDESEDDETEDDETEDESEDDESEDDESEDDETEDENNIINHRQLVTEFYKFQKKYASEYSKTTELVNECDKQIKQISTKLSALVSEFYNMFITNIARGDVNK